MKQTITNILKFILFLSVGLVILYFVFQKQETAYIEECALKGIPDSECSLIDKIIIDFKSANYWWILVVFSCYLLSNIARALRWGMVIAPMGRTPKFHNLFGTVMLGYFGNLGLPRLGEVMRPVAFSGYEKIPVERVVGTVILERIIDVLFLGLCIGLCLLLEFDAIYQYVEQWLFKEKSGDSNMLLYSLGGIGIVVLAIGLIFRKQILATSIAQKILGLVKGFIEGILSIRKVKNQGLFWFYSAFIWLMYFSMTYLCFFAFAPTAHLSPTVGLLTFVVGAIAIVIPSPGGMGTYHAFVSSLLVAYGISNADAFSFANIMFFSVQLGINVAVGLVCMMALPYLNRNYNPKPIENEGTTI